MALETGSHSPWASRLLQKYRHDVIVANPLRVRVIGESDRKNDRVDARTLARLARIDNAILHSIRHRCEEAQAALAVLRARDALVQVRTKLMNCARGMVKSVRGRLPGAFLEAGPKNHLPIGGLSWMWLVPLLPVMRPSDDEVDAAIGVHLWTTGRL